MPAQFAWFFLSFRGRISRQEFWLGYAFTIVVMLLMIPLLKDLALLRPAGRAVQREELMIAVLMGTAIATAILLWPLLTLYVKRLHDLNVSGWWLVCFFVMMAAIDLTGIMRTDHASVALVGAIGFARGQRGDNRFGPDPIVTRT